MIGSKPTKEKVLLAIGLLSYTKTEIRQGAIAKAMCNGEMVTKEMIKPFLDELENEHLIETKVGPKKFEHAIPVPVIILTAEGCKMIGKLKALQN